LVKWWCGASSPRAGRGSRMIRARSATGARADLPSETLAKRLLATVTPVYLLDFDDEAPVTMKLDRRKARVTETRVDEHPADFCRHRPRRGPLPPGSPGTTDPPYRPLAGEPRARSRGAEGAERSELALGAPSMGAKLEVKQ
jgi:hypothetical protein